MGNFFYFREINLYYQGVTSYVSTAHILSAASAERARAKWHSRTVPATPQQCSGQQSLPDTELISRLVVCGIDGRCYR